MIKQAELEQAYLLGRQAAMEKLSEYRKAVTPTPVATPAHKPEPPKARVKKERKKARPARGAVTPTPAATPAHKPEPPRARVKKSDDRSTLEDLALTLGGGALASRGLQGLDRAVPMIRPAVSLSLAEQLQKMNPEAAKRLAQSIGMQGVGSTAKMLANPNLYKNLQGKIPLSALGSMGALGLGTYGAYKGLSHLLGDD